MIPTGDMTAPAWLVAAIGGALILITATCTAALTRRTRPAPAPTSAPRAEPNVTAAQDLEPEPVPPPGSEAPQSTPTIRAAHDTPPGDSDDADDVVVDDDGLGAGLIGAFDLATENPAVRAHIERVLNRAGIVQIPVAVGDTFDPEEHLVVEATPSSEGHAGRVARLVRPGWSRNGTLVRPAEVAVWST